MLEKICLENSYHCIENANVNENNFLKMVYIYKILIITLIKLKDITGKNQLVLQSKVI